MGDVVPIRRNETYRRMGERNIRLCWQALQDGVDDHEMVIELWHRFKAGELSFDPYSAPSSEPPSPAA